MLPLHHTQRVMRHICCAPRAPPHKFCMCCCTETHSGCLHYSKAHCHNGFSQIHTGAAGAKEKRMHAGRRRRCTSRPTTLTRHRHCEAEERSATLHDFVLLSSNVALREAGPGVILTVAGVQYNRWLCENRQHANPSFASVPPLIGSSLVPFWLSSTETSRRAPGLQPGTGFRTKVVQRGALPPRLLYGASCGVLGQSHKL
jgi:hypothetical protein